MKEVSCSQCNSVLAKGEKLHRRKNLAIYCGNCFVGKSNKNEVPDLISFMAGFTGGKKI